MGSPAWIEEYWERGFVRIPGVFPAAEVAELGAYFDEVLERAARFRAIAKEGLTEYRIVPVAGRPTLKFAKWAAASHAGLDRFRLSPRLLGLAMQALGPDLRSITNQMHYKNPGDGVSFQMHQDCAFRKPDSAYRDLYGGFLQTAIAVDPATAENGCLQMIPYSHRGKRPLLAGGYEGWDANGANRRVLERLAPPEPGLMDPGDVMIWNPFTIHGSQANRSSRSRRVYINGFARSGDTDHGVDAAVAGEAVPLVVGPGTRWDAVEER